MRVKFTIFFILFGPLSILSANDWDSFTYFPPMGILYHPVSTKSKQAQEAFNRGLLAIYAFNYDQALQSFEEASQWDPNLAMAYWGMALAIDETLDKFSTPNHTQLTFYLYEKAAALSQQATLKEQAYIQALSSRFSNDFTSDKNILRKKYMESMAQLVAAYPDDLDATVLYAESIMDILAWDLWTPKQTPREGTLHIVTLLESVLKRNPLHIGANHYYIHALENSPYPERALMSADRLDRLNLTDWAHLIHTSSHIYLHVGSYEKAVLANQKAIQYDKEYIKTYGIEGRYPLKYLAHNFFYLTIAYLWQEQFEKAIASALDLEALVKPYVKTVPSMEYNLLMPLQVYLYFHRWEDILNIPQPLSGLVEPLWAFGYAMAYAELGNEAKAETALDFFRIKQKEFFASQPGDHAFARQLFTFADKLVLASLSKTKGNLNESLNLLKEAESIQEQDLGDFIWPYPVSQTIGACLIAMQRYEEAEKVFRKTLDKFPRNGRTLFGLSQALELQGKTDYALERECKYALRYADKQLKLNDL